MTLLRAAPNGVVTVVVAIAIALSLSSTACDSADRRDAQVVVLAIRRFRSADNPSTPAAVDALKTTPCSAPDACQAKDTCLAAGESIAQALRISSAVEQGLAAMEKGTLSPESPEAQALPTKLEESKKLLAKGVDGLPACDEQFQALKRKHRI